MNGYSWDLPPNISCPVQSEICRLCYAKKGHFVRPAAKDLRYHNFHALVDKGYGNWILWILEELDKRNIKYFRWHSSGDVFCKQYLDAIYTVCRSLPSIKFWMPSHNYPIFEERPPKNLQVHLSCMQGTTQERNCKKHKGTRIKLAYMYTEKPPRRTYVCPCSGKDPARPKNCDEADCRRCWNKDASVAFHYH